MSAGDLTANGVGGVASPPPFLVDPVGENRSTKPSSWPIVSERYRKLFPIVKSFLTDLLFTTERRSLRLSRFIMGISGALFFLDAFFHREFLVLHTWDVPLTKYDFSLFSVLNDSAFAGALALFFSAASLLWGMGIRERATAMLALIGMISTNGSIHDLSTGGNMVWCLFLVGYLLIKDRNQEVVRDAAVFWLKLQFLMIYFTGILLKSADRYWQHGDSIAVNLRAFLWETDIGRWMGYEMPNEVLRYMTYGTLLIEYLIPLFIFFPVRHRLASNIAFLLVVIFHLGTALFMHLGIFPYAMIGYAAILLRWPSNAGLLTRKMLPIRSLKNFLKSFIAVSLVALVFIEFWNEKIRETKPEWWVAWPGRMLLQNTVGFNESWGMFTSRVKKPRPERVRTGNMIVLLKGKDGKLFSPSAGRNFWWGKEFVTAQNRGVMLRKLFAGRPGPGEGRGTVTDLAKDRRSDAWYLTVASHYASQAEEEVTAVYFYRFITYFHLERNAFPYRGWVSHAGLVQIWKGEPYKFVRGSGKAKKIALQKTYFDNNYSVLDATTKIVRSASR